MNTKCPNCDKDMLSIFSKEKNLHVYCHSCGSHFYNDKWISKKEWELWIEESS